MASRVGGWSPGRARDHGGIAEHVLEGEDLPRVCFGKHLGRGFVPERNNLTGVSPNLGPLQDNGGPTPTHAPLTGSPVVDAGNPAVPGSSDTACEALDQQGVTRPQGARCDIGAVEVGGTPTTSTTTTTSSTTTTIPSLCGQVPQGGCQVALSGKGSLLIKDRSDDAKDLFGWKWRSSGQMTKVDFGSPTATTDYAVCVYDQGGAGPTLRLAATAPAGGVCAGRPCWKETSTGFRYADRELTPAGLAAIRLKAGAAGMGRITVKGRGASLPLPSLPLTPPVTVQLQRSDGAGCWAATFSAPTTNTAEQFKAIPAPVFEETACEVQLPTGQRAANASCGFVAVPEDRAQPSARMIKLPVVVLKATGPNPASDPLVYLGGGPGDPVLRGSMLNWTAAFAAPIQEKRDLVFFDPRGVDLSEPALDPCPERQQAFLENLTEASTVVEKGMRLVSAMRTCHDRMARNGVDFSAYTSAAIAADMVDLMTALGYREWNVYGLSYGGRIALTAMRDRPGPIRSVVLDSTLPIEVNHDADQAANGQRQLDTLLAACASDPSCDAAYPHLDQIFFHLVAQLNATPAVLHPRDANGETFTVVVTGDLLLLGITEALADDSLIPFLPILIGSAGAGEYTLLTQAAGLLAGGGDSNFYGMSYSVRCHEEIPFSTAAVIDAATAGVREEVREAVVPYTTDVNRETCEFWGSKAPRAIENAPVLSPLPAMILTGEFDSLASYGPIMAHDLSRSFMFPFRGQGHVQIYGHYDPATAPCAIHLIADFLDQPTHEPDSTCVNALPPPPFLVAG